MFSIRNLIRTAREDPYRVEFALIVIVLVVLAMTDLAGVVGEAVRTERVGQ